MTIKELCIFVGIYATIVGGIMLYGMHDEWQVPNGPGAVPVDRLDMHYWQEMRKYDCPTRLEDPCKLRESWKI